MLQAHSSPEKLMDLCSSKGVPYTYPIVATSGVWSMASDGCYYMLFSERLEGPFAAEAIADRHTILQAPWTNCVIYRPGDEPRFSVTFHG